MPERYATTAPIKALAQPNANHSPPTAPICRAIVKKHHLFDAGGVTAFCRPFLFMDKSAGDEIPLPMTRAAWDQQENEMKRPHPSSILRLVKQSHELRDNS